MVRLIVDYRKMLRLAVAAGVAVWTLAGTASGSVLVVPNSQTSAPGTPDSIPVVTNQNMREQQVLGPGQFNTGQILITQIAFRFFPGSGPVNVTISSLKLYLSTSQYFSNTNGGKTVITTTFATNVGPDNTLVYSGPGSLISPGCPGPAAYRSRSPRRFRGPDQWCIEFRNRNLFPGRNDHADRLHCAWFDVQYKYRHGVPVFHRGHTAGGQRADR